MKALALYALEVLACSGVLLAAYAILLERRVRFGWCRTYLLLSTPLAAVIPLLRIPVWPGGVIEAVPTVAMPAEWSAQVIETPVSVLTPEAVCLAVYLVGAGLIAGVMVWQTVRIRRLRRGAEITRTDCFTLVRTPQRIASFSFFRSIYVWRETPVEEMKAIVAHEASHIAHRHSAERIAMECMKAALWWNPFVWIAARRLTEAEEFEADSDVLAGGYDLEDYMKTIFRQLFGYSPEIANGLRDSLTKKRFKMMTTKTRGRYALLRLAGTLPALVGLLCAFSFTTRAAEFRTPTSVEVPADAATKNVRIRVSKEGRPLDGAIVLIAGSTKGTVTDAEGRASIDAQPGATLVISYVGCEPAEIRLSDQPEAESHMLALKAEANKLDPITVTTDPKTKPLFVVDGVERPGIDDLNPANIEWIRVLKDWDSVKKYGERGKNGVIEVGTKRAANSGENPAGGSPKTVRSGEDEPFLIAETMPLFRGGDLNAFRAWAQRQIVYPAEAMKQGIEGRVVVTFVVKTDGSVGDINVLQSPDQLLTDEARRVIASSPAGAWTPGQQRGKNVAVKYTLPVDFRLTKTEPAPARDEATFDPATGTIQTTPAGDDEPFLIAETMPSFRGGDLNAFRAWAQRQIVYPAEAMKQGIEGRVVVTFVVKTDGSVGDINVLQSPDQLLTDEARRVIASSPAGAWTPGQQRGKNVAVKYTLPVDFRITPQAEKTAQKAGDDEPFLVAETMPSFQGGDIVAFRKWVQMQIKYPSEALKEKLYGRVVASFVVEKDGSVSSIEVLQSPGKALAEEARRVIRDVPAGAWTPGRQRGQAVRVKYTMPVDFLIQDVSGDLPQQTENSKGSIDRIIVVGYGDPK